MKIISKINDINDLNNFSNVDEIVVSTIFSTFYVKAFGLDDINKIISWAIINKKKAIVNVDAIFDEATIKHVYNLLDKLFTYDCYFMFSDMAILYYFKNKDMIGKLIYNAPSYICNNKDIEYYKNLGIRCFVSNELSIDDLKYNSNFDNTIIQVYGYYPIYYTKRKVVSIYKDHFLNDSEFTYDNLEIKEETREDKYPIIEYTSAYNKHSLILNSKKICIYQELKDINANYIYIESYKEEHLEEVIDLYKNITYNDSDIIRLDERVDKSLLYSNPSILNKDEK